MQVSPFQHAPIASEHSNYSYWKLWTNKTHLNKQGTEYRSWMFLHFWQEYEYELVAEIKANTEGKATILKLTNLESPFKP